MLRLVHRRDDGVDAAGAHQHVEIGKHLVETP
jgi:hypothetical protein